MNVIEINDKSEKYPKRILQIKNHPKTLYALGNTDLLNKERIIAIVGTRECTEYGRKVASYFSSELSKEDICIISGMAIGIDTAAHNMAIEEAGKTIAVLGGGFNHIYPKENEWLFNKILANDGCIITEYEINVEPNMRNFPKRNRIISGLSDGVLVVEAEYRSGSTITAGYAKQQGKTVYSIPSNIDSSKGIGTNKLIQEGAKLITKPSQIYEYMNINITKEKRKIDENRIIPKEYLPIYNLLSDEPIHINKIAKELDTTVSQINAIITLMELDGYIIQLAGNEFKKKE